MLKCFTVFGIPKRFLRFQISLILLLNGKQTIWDRICLWKQYWVKILAMVLSLTLTNYYGFENQLSKRLIIPLCDLGTLFLLLGCHVPLQHEKFSFILLYFLSLIIIFWKSVLLLCKAESVPRREERGRNWEEWREGEL